MVHYAFAILRKTMINLKKGDKSMNKDTITAKSINIHTTTQCTLRCKKCGWSFPKFSPKIHSDKDLTIRSLDKLFQVYDYVEDFRLAGAESFLHPEIEELLIAASKYKAYFGYLCVITNGSYMPRASILDTLSGLDCKTLIRVDNYGKLSGMYEEVIHAMKSKGITIDERNYNENEQFMGGWVDLGDYEHKNYSDVQLRDVFAKCRMPDDCAVLWDGKLYNCQYCVSGLMLGKIEMAEREIVDLFDDSTVLQRRNTIKAWRNEPFIGCSYCNGFEPGVSPRIPAAEQMEQEEKYVQNTVD